MGWENYKLALVWCENQIRARWMKCASWSVLLGGVPSGVPSGVLLECAEFAGWSYN